MTQQVFERVEKKYLIRREVCGKLEEELKQWMLEDKHEQHTISNIYFDTEDYDLIRRSIEKTEYKEKFRLRAYGAVDESSMIYAELKKKYNGIVYKRRTAMSLDLAVHYFWHRGEMPENNQVFKEIQYVFQRYDLKPAAYISYDRRAFFGKDNKDLRLTFDCRIRCRNQKLDFRETDANVFLLSPEEILMEVKIPGAMPVWMARIFSELCIFPTSYSKYGTYYKNYLYQDYRRQDYPRPGYPHQDYRYPEMNKASVQEKRGGEWCA